jgi:hypothetical protein
MQLFMSNLASGRAGRGWRAHGVAIGDRNRAPSAIMRIVNTTAPATHSEASVISIPVDPHWSCAQPLMQTI